MAQWKRAPILVILDVVVCTLFCFAGESKWIEVKSPNFVVISDASAKEARRTARSLEQFRSLLQTLLPKVQMDSGYPLIAFALRDEKGLKALLPGELLQKGSAMPGGLFIGGPERNFVLLRTDAPEDQRYHAIYHEYVHLVMQLNFQDLPTWLSEGFAEFFAYAKVADGTSEIGNPSPELLFTLQNRPMIPLAEFMEITRDSPYYHRQGLVEVFYAQSWALTHYFMVGDKRAHVQPLTDFLGLLQRDVPEREAARRAFGDMKALEQNLQDYVRMMSFYHFRLASKLGEKEDQYPVRELAPAESLAARGEVLVHVNRIGDASAMLEKALQLDPRSALVNEGLGILFNRQGNQEQAEKYFAAAVELDSRSFLAHYYAAHAAYQRGDYAMEGNCLRKALALNPNFVPALQNLSDHLARKGEKLPEALDLAKRAAALEPANLTHSINIGRILILMDKDEEAAALADRILAAARTDADRSGAESLLSLAKARREGMIAEQKRAEALKEEARKIEEQRRQQRELQDQARTREETRQPDGKPAPIKTGPAAKATGRIRSVQCSDPAVMDIVLDSNGNLQKLRAQNYYQVQYWAVGAPGRTGFDPCKELEGKPVEVEFLRVAGQEFSGLIKSVAIGK